MKLIIGIVLCSSLGCASLSAVNKDSDLIEKYPQCYHQYRTVFDNCIALNRKGKKINAIRVEKLMKDGEYDSE